jgi:NAD(P)-dependent dehydrogenase (short-subunit alcohol dehydrogenase family)
MAKSISLDGKVAFVTGGGSGIGRGSAVAFAGAGAKVAVVERSADAADETLKLIRDAGGEAEVFPADVSDPASIKGAADAAAERFGRLDVVHANAGINGVWAPLEEITAEEYDRTMDTNLRGTFFTFQATVPHLKASGGGVLIATSSIQGTRIFSNSGATVYGATKAGQVAMVKILAVELGPFQIRVHAICPGGIETNINASTEQRHTENLGVKAEHPEGTSPLTGKTPGTIDEVGDVALFLASDLARHVNGEIVYVDGGESLVVG